MKSSCNGSSYHTNNSKRGRQNDGSYCYCYLYQPFPKCLSFVGIAIVLLQSLPIILHLTTTMSNWDVQQQQQRITTTKTITTTSKRHKSYNTVRVSSSSSSMHPAAAVAATHVADMESVTTTTTTLVYNLTANNDEVETPIRSYPRWGSSIEEENQVGIDFKPIWNFLVSSSSHVFRGATNDDPNHNTSTTTTSITTTIPANPYYRPTLDHGILQPTTLGWLPEVLYTIEPSTTTLQSTSMTAAATTTTTTIQPPKLFGSNTHRKEHIQSNSQDFYDKLIHTERSMIEALHILHTNVVDESIQLVQSLQNEKDKQQNQNICQRSRWPTLCTILYPSISERKDSSNDGPRSNLTTHDTLLTTDHHQLSTSTEGISSGGFPFLAWYGDYIGCNYNNWEMAFDNGHTRKQSQPSQLQPRTDPILKSSFRRHQVPNTRLVSIPLFTVAADSACNYTIPFPNFYIKRNSFENVSQWDEVMQKKQQLYPWSEKIHRVVWRGSFTGNVPDNQTKCPRWRMMEEIHNIDSQRQQQQLEEMFDARISYVPMKSRKYLTDIERDIGGSHMIGRVHSISFDDFQKYRAILDVDGNSWSGRFPSLLCSNSVILKVDPYYHEYFHARLRYNHRQNQNNSNYNDDGHQNPSLLQAWRHYIPIQNDFSNLQKAAEYALDPQNDDHIQAIIQNANVWCRMNMVYSVIAKDMLDVWDRYVQLLNTNDANWSQSYWNEPNKNEKIYSHETASFQMIELEPLYDDPSIFTKEYLPDIEV